MAGLATSPARLSRTTPERRVSVDELLSRPNDGKRYELINGRVIEMSPPLNLHQIVVARLLLLMGPALKSPSDEVIPSPVGVRVTEFDYLEPDLVYISGNHPESGKVVGIYTKPPELVIEVLSPSNTQAEMFTKARLYERAGVQNYWIADPVNRLIEAFTLQDSQYEIVVQTDQTQLVAPPFPDLVIEFDREFPHLDPLPLENEATRRKLKKIP